MHKAIDAVKKDYEDGYPWYDSKKKEEIKLFIRRHKSVEERQLGRFQTHFYRGVEQAIKDSTKDLEGTKVRIAKQKLHVEYQGDVLQLMFFEEASEDGYKASADYANFKELGIEAKTVDTLLAIAIACAKAA